MTRMPGCGAIRRKLLLDPYAKAIDGEVGWDPAPSTAIRWRRRPCPQRRGQRALRAPVGGHQPLVRVGRRPPAADPAGTRPSCMSATSKGFTMRHPEIPDGPAGHLRRHGAPRRDRAPAAPRRHRGGADAGPPLRPRPPPGRPRAAQLLGIQLDRLFRPAQRVLGVGRRAGRLRVQGTW